MSTKQQKTTDIMSKAELTQKLKDGYALEDLLRFSPGQDCDIYKAGAFAKDDTVIYIPDLSMNGIVTDAPITDPDELEHVLSQCYTGNDFAEECGGDWDLAERLFWFCDWQHPSTAMGEGFGDDENDEDDDEENEVKTMTAKELANKLNGRKYGTALLPDEEQEAKKAGLVVVCGYSDDVVEFRGAIDYEAEVYGSSTLFVTHDGVLDEPACSNAENCACPYFISAKKVAKAITAIWHENHGPCWTFETEIPHETFSVIEDREVFEKGIVFCVNDIPKYQNDPPSYLDLCIALSDSLGSDLAMPKEIRIASLDLVAELTDKLFPYSA